MSWKVSVDESFSKYVNRKFIIKEFWANLLTWYKGVGYDFEHYPFDVRTWLIPFAAVTVVPAYFLWGCVFGRGAVLKALNMAAPHKRHNGTINHKDNLVVLDLWRKEKEKL